MNIIIKNINKETASEIVNDLDKLINEGITLDCGIDETED